MEKLEKLFSSLEGRILCYGIMEENYLTCIQKNKKIKECFLLNSTDLKRSEKGGRTRKISPKTFLRRFGKKSMDILVINEEELGNLEKRLISLFIKVTKTRIYIYHISDLEKVKKRYKRYHGNCKDRKDYLEVDITKTRQNAFMDKVYYVWDSCIDVIDLISDFLVS